MSAKVGHVHLIFFTDRNPIPSETTYNVTPDNRLGAERVEERKIAGTYEREMEVDIVLDAETAKHLFDDLKTFIEANSPKKQ